MKLARVLPSLGLLLALVACRKQEDEPHRTEPWLAHPSASAVTEAAAPLTLRFTPESRVRFKLVGKKAQVSGSAPVSEGTLLLDPVDLTRSRASLLVDLNALSVEEGEAPDGAPARETALSWLELGPDVAADKRAQFRFARFELTAIEGWSGRPLSVYGHKKSATERVTAVGTLLLHGFRAPVRTDVVLSLSGSGQVQQVSIHSGSVLVLPLAPHDIGARGPNGVLDAVLSARARDALGSAVRLEADLTARP